MGAEVRGHQERRGARGRFEAALLGRAAVRLQQGKDQQAGAPRLLCKATVT